jgi:beta-lactamase class A
MKAMSIIKRFTLILMALLFGSLSVVPTQTVFAASDEATSYCLSRYRDSDSKRRACYSGYDGTRDTCDLFEEESYYACLEGYNGNSGNSGNSGNPSHSSSGGSSSGGSSSSSGSGSSTSNSRLSAKQKSLYWQGIYKFDENDCTSSNNVAPGSCAALATARQNLGITSEKKELLYHCVSGEGASDGWYVQMHLEANLNRLMNPGYFSDSMISAYHGGVCEKPFSGDRAIFDAAWEKVMSGSNVTNFSTDYGSRFPSFAPNCIGTGSNCFPTKEDYDAGITCAVDTRADTDCSNTSKYYPILASGHHSYFTKQKAGDVLNKVITDCGGSSSSSSGGGSLTDDVNSLIAGLQSGTKASVGYQELGGGAPTVIGETGQMLSASVIKMYIAAFAISKGMNTEDMRKMISNSDNDATNRVIDAVGGVSAVDSYISGKGWSNTKLNRKIGQPNGTESYTSSADSLDFLAKLYNHQINGTAGDDILLGYMKNQDTHNDAEAGETSYKIRYALDGKSDINFIANKTGEHTNSRATANDVAIVSTAKGDFLLTIFTNYGDYNANVEFNRSVAEAAYNAFAGGGDDCDNSASSNSDFMNDDSWIYYNQGNSGVDRNANSYDKFWYGSDSRGNDIYCAGAGCGGCMTFTVTMAIANLLGDKNITPKSVYDEQPIKYFDFYISNAKDYVNNSSHGLSAKMITRDEIDSYLDQGAIIVHGVSGISGANSAGHVIRDWGGQGHYVVIRGKNSDGMYKIADPANYTTLTDLWPEDIIKNIPGSTGYIMAVQKGS